MPTIDGTSFRLDGSLDLPADGYSLEIAGTADYRNPGDPDTVALKAGYTDAETGVSYNVGAIEGPVDEYSITIAKDRMTCSVQGRDKMAELIERKFERRYLRMQPTAAEKKAMEERTFNGALDPLSFVVGSFTAKDIVKDVVESCGLRLSWECRDYTILEDFDATGRCLDILKRLVEPWMLVERFGVDVLVQGDVVIFRPRPPTLTPDYSLGYKDGRVKSITIRRRRGQRYGKVTLLGKLVANLSATGGVYQPYEMDEVTTSETKDAAGNVLQRVIRTTTYRMPEKIVLQSREQTFDKQGGRLKLVKDETRANEWEDIPYTESGATRQPRQLSQSTNVSGIHPSDKSKRFRALNRETVAFSYEQEGYQDMTTTRKWEVNLKRNTFDETERVVRVLKDIDNLKTEEVTSTYSKGKAGEFYLSHFQSNISAGLRPGGPRPGRTIVIGDPNGPKTPVKVEAVISDHVWAEDLHFSNPNLEQEDLDYLLACLQTASGQWEYEVSLDYVAMPWLRKGNVIKLTGLLAEDGVTPIPIGPAIIQTMELTYVEERASAQMVSRLTAKWWE